MSEQNLKRTELIRLDGVDLIRGLGIIAVVLSHINTFASQEDVSLWDTLPEWMRDVFFRNGGNGVSAFFVVSGCLITLNSIRRFGSLDRMRVGKFYRRRFARIAPPLLLLLAVLTVLHLSNLHYFHIEPTVCSLPIALLSALALHLNWLEASHGWLPACWTVLWSLSVEEAFYLVFPLASAGLLKRRWTRAALSVFILGLVLTGPFARTVLTSNLIWQRQSYLGNMDGIALGCLCAVAVEWCATNRNFACSKWPVIAQAIGTVAMMFVVAFPWRYTILGLDVKRELARMGVDVTVLTCGTAFFLWGSIIRGRKGWQITSPIRWFGRRSYEVYLSHEFVVIGGLTVYFALDRGPETLWICLIVATAAFLGLVFAKYFSEPMNRKLNGERHR